MLCLLLGLRQEVVEAALASRRSRVPAILKASRGAGPVHLSNTHSSSPSPEERPEVAAAAAALQLPHLLQLLQRFPGRPHGLCEVYRLLLREGLPFLGISVHSRPNQNLKLIYLLVLPSAAVG
eukprot:CAMPEP_0206611344 /NCGR_PEP_ID=MMETSP0325_2-20121206/55199_1 /ASSEMBLY_ACC=CAM_ASM_000347 /TAXON_ID=2866 /ORGANISM="Crypthecodinium cohnii, Strain Seligo" /LENGTH=122 /DNA_ID=CAMNT_0054130549 /DNA_START=207 /DNA_END=575 /DNA_ORIENTATION=-